MVSTEYLAKEINFDVSNKKLLEEIINYGLNLGADFVEIFLENTDNISVLVEEDFITSVSPSFGKGAGIRIFKDKRDGFVSTNDLSKDGLIKSVSQAVQMLDITETSPKGKFQGLEDLRNYSKRKNDWLKKLPSVDEIGDKLLLSTASLKKDPKVNIRKSSYARNWQQVLIASSDGTFAKDIRLHQTVGLNLIATEGNIVPLAVDVLVPQIIQMILEIGITKKLLMKF